jgi:alanyl-tRNA synthetase
VPVITELYKKDYPEVDKQEHQIVEVLMREETQFRRTLERGVRELEKLAADGLTGQEVFMLSDTYGFPWELTIEEATDKKIKLDPKWRTDFDRLMAEQKDRSRTASAGQFKGGLADHSEMSTKYHTATHLMYKALRNVLGDHVIQRGSNITPERLRFDFSHPDKVTPEQIAEVERIVNEQIDKDWPMGWREEPTKAALASGVMGAFGDRYGEVVKVYTVGNPDGDNYSREICGGPHQGHPGIDKTPSKFEGVTYWQETEVLCQPQI